MKNKNQFIYPQQYIPYWKSKNGLPASETSFLLNFIGLFVAFFTILCVKWIDLDLSVLQVFTLFVGVLIGVIGALEFSVGNRKIFYDRIKIRRKVSWKRCGYKLLALFFIWGIIAFCYWLFPVYKDRLFQTYLEVLGDIYWILGLVGIVYFIFLDRVLEHPDDAYWQLGRWLCGHRKDVVKAEIMELFRGWGVKFFYLALMLPYLFERLDRFMNTDFTLLFYSPRSFFYNLNNLIFLVDLSFAAIGYMMTLRVFNTQIRSTEPTLLGWLVALACYWPIWGALVGEYYLAYNTGINWMSVFGESTSLFVVWAVLILLLELIYSLSTVALGLRFSNLTYRGLVTCGPYRFTKHPAYVFKNISWWLISMPFLAWSTDWQLAVRGSLLLLGVNMLYYIRAKTEENHLSHYPEYVEYALKMNEKSIFAPIARLLPFLKYKAPQNV